MNFSQTLIFVFLFIANQSFARNDTIRYAEKSEQFSPLVFALPSALISYGIIARISPPLRNLDRSIDGKISQNVRGRYVFDDYIQYAPYAGIYLPDLFGVKAKHNLIDRTLVLGSSILICTSAVQIPKRFTGVTRPDGSNRHSFPSGHTATAFLGAHLLFREYEDTAPWAGIAGYGVATATGVMRMVNRKHWFSDVLAGAGIGIISVELSYRLLPVWHRLFKMNQENSCVIINPLVNENGWGVGIILAL